MKESEAKKMKCPHHYTAHVLALQNILLDKRLNDNYATREQVTESVHSQKVMNCDGSDCVMWEPEYEEKRYVQEEATMPPQDDELGKWQKKAREAGKTRIVWFRYVPTDRGDCGLKSKEQGCNFG